MATPQTLHGARAIVHVNGKPIGIFSTFSYGLTYEVQPVPILGRYSPAELVYTAQNEVRCSATGWRVFNQGPHAGPSVPHLADLISHEDFQIIVTDRQNPTKSICVIKNVRPESYSTTINNRSLTDVTVNFVGLVIEDESGENSERADASRLDIV